MRLIITFAVLSALVTLPAPRANGADQTVCYQARDAYNARAYDAAARLLGQCLEQVKLTPESRASVLRASASSYMQLGQYDRARADLEAAMRDQPGHPEGYLSRGELNRLQGQLEAALRDYDEGLRLDPNNRLAREVREATASQLAATILGRSGRRAEPSRPDPASTARPESPERPPERPVERSRPNPMVQEAQRLLATLGYLRGPANGQLDDATRNAIASFQRVQGLWPDGRVTAELIDRLQASL